jgi:phosphatidylserine/phosphatidylglycerophosphate/cardiolipin synthase-like enzyme
MMPRTLDVRSRPNNADVIKGAPKRRVTRRLGHVLGVAGRAFFALAISGSMAKALEVHYAPQENLESVDVDLIDDSDESIDMAAYVLSDQAVISALIEAAERGVVIRLYLDKSQYAEHDPLRGGLIEQLLGYPNVFARVKGRGVLMHLKAYVVDHRKMRTGSGNFSRPGLAEQDNDLIVVEDSRAIRQFESNFDAIFARGANFEALTRIARGGPR